MAFTLKDIADELGVSSSLVSQVLNGKAKEHRIKSETVSLVLKKAKEMGYVPNQVARGLRLKRSRNIALITPDLANPFFAALTKIIQNELRKKGYNLMICGTNDDTTVEKNEIELLKAKGVDGLIIIPVGSEYKHLKRLVYEKFPFVLLYRTFKQFNTNFVTVDNYTSVFRIVKLLISKGHRKIGLVQGKRNILTNRERLRGYKDALKECKLKYSEDYIVGHNFTTESGYLSAKKLLKLKVPPTVIITTSELITLGALHAIIENNLKIPEDISIVGFDSLEITDSLMVPICSVIPPKNLLGETAVKILLDDIEGANAKRKTKVMFENRFDINDSILIKKQIK